MTQDDVVHVRDSDSGTVTEGYSLQVTPDASNALIAMRSEVRAWLRAVSLQEARVVDTAEMDLRMMDARQFALVLRLLYRACKATAGLTMDPAMNEAVVNFERAHPGAVHIRDVTEHFDAYINGKGRLGEGVRTPVYSYTSGVSTHLIQVADLAPNGVLRRIYNLDVSLAARDARAMAAAVL